jgi:hypothetical protein
VLHERPVLISTGAAVSLSHTFPATHLYFANTAPPTEGLTLAYPQARVTSTFLKKIFSNGIFEEKFIELLPGIY